MPAAISLTSLTPGVVDPTSTLVIKGTVTNTGLTPIENGAIRLLVHHSPLATRGLVAQWSNGGIDDAPPGFLAWFDVPERKTQDITVVFGHWAALGLKLRENLCALDSGCVWGNQLSALRLSADPMQRQLTQVDCAAPAPSAMVEE